MFQGPSWWVSPLLILMWHVFILKRCIFGWPYYSLFLFAILSALGIWSDCPNKALTICLQQLLYDPRPKVHPVVPEAAAPDRGGEVGGHSAHQGKAVLLARGILHPAPHLAIYATAVKWAATRASVFKGAWCSRKSRIDGSRRCAFRFLLYHLFISVTLTKSLILPDLQDAHL